MLGERGVDHDRTEARGGAGDHSEPAGEALGRRSGGDLRAQRCLWEDEPPVEFLEQRGELRGRQARTNTVG